jgi:TonB family protein
MGRTIRAEASRLTIGAAALALLGVAGCEGAREVWEKVVRRDTLELPVLLTSELPFRYPASLFFQRIEGDVTLKLYIDSTGRVVAESTAVVQHSGYPAFDTAAVEGAAQLLFRPARRGDRRVGLTVLFPVKFKMPPTSKSDTSTAK